MTDETQFTDDYFINLTMDYDKRDDSIYPKWAVWCAQSDDKYYIDGKDGHFYTHVRTDREIAIEKKRREIIEFGMQQDVPHDEKGYRPDSYVEYDIYLRKLAMDDDKVLDANPLTYEEWLAEQNKEESM